MNAETQRYAFILDTFEVEGLKQSINIHFLELTLFSNTVKPRPNNHTDRFITKS